MCKADKNIDILSKMMYNNAECNILHTIAEANMKKGLNASTLKLIAIITMVIDHISWGFFDFYSWQGYMLHIIGRLTIPIMCFFIAEGFRKTHDLKKYILRMTFLPQFRSSRSICFSTKNMPIAKT